MSSPWTSARQAAAKAWQQRAPRERRLLTLGATVLLAAMLWSWLLAPAWRVWNEAPARQASLEAHTRQMLQLQAEARLLQAPSRIERSQALKLLSDSASLLGPNAKLDTEGDALRVSLQAATPSGLAQWLAQARDKAQVRPRLAQLQQQPAAAPSLSSRRSADPISTPDEAASAPLWAGTLVLQLP